MSAETAGRRLRVLHAIHDFLPNHRAGSEIYAATLCRELGTRHHVTVVCAEYDPARPHGQLTWRLHDDLPVVEIANNWVCGSFADTYRSPLISQRVEQVLRQVQPHVVHIHNLLNLSFDLPAAARARGIPVVATLHDYTLVCASGGQRVHRADAHVCRTIDTARCVRCFEQSPFYTQAACGGAAAFVSSSRIIQRGVAAVRARAPALVRTAGETMKASRIFRVTEADIAERLARGRAVFDQIDAFVAPSRSIAEEFVSLGLDRAKVRVADYGFAPVARAPRQPRGVRLRIGFVGTLVWHKGVHVLLDAIKRLPPEAYELEIHGDPRACPEYVADLRRRANGLPVRFSGVFDDSRTSAVYAGRDLLVVPSVWLENSPLVIHEAFRSGVPVVASRIGGHVDLIGDSVNGRLYDPQSSGELATILQSLIETPATLNSWAAKLPPVRAIADDARDWERVYLEVSTPARALAPAHA